MPGRWPSSVAVVVAVVLRYFTPATTHEVRAALAERDDLGAIVTPKDGQRTLYPGTVWVADNGVFGKHFPGEAAWFDWLAALPYPRAECAFVVAPDVVGDALATYTRSLRWMWRVRALGLPVAFVAQDGIEDVAIPWREFDVLFIGGTDEFKLGPVAAGVPVHLGRVNSLKRLRFAAAHGCTSADGTYIAFGPTKNLERMGRWVAHVNAESTTPSP